MAEEAALPEDLQEGQEDDDTSNSSDKESLDKDSNQLNCKTPKIDFI